MNATSSDSLKFAVVLVRWHSSQSLQTTLTDLQSHVGCIEDLFILHSPNSAPDDTDSVLLARLGVRAHVREIDINRMTEAINMAAVACASQQLMFLRAGDGLAPAYMQQLSEAFKLNPLGALFYSRAIEHRDGAATGRVIAGQSVQQVKPDWNLPDPCVLSGLAVRKSHFVAMGGFHQGCQVVLHLDFWLRTHITMSDSIVYLPNLAVHIQVDHEQVFIKLGARELLEWYTLNKRYSSWCGAQRLLRYSEVVLQVTQSRPDLAIGLHEHMCDVSNRLLFMVAPSERNLLQPWLQNSIAVSSARAEFTSIDQCLKGEFDSAIEHLPNLYEGGYSIHSIGSFCHAAQVLKDLALRRHTGPFDWIFSSAGSAAHMIKDGFRTFLDPQFFVEVPDDEKQDPSSNKCDHAYYREHFGVRFMFNHHVPIDKKDADFFRDAVQAIKSDLDGAYPCVLLHVARPGGKPESYQPLWDSLQRYSAPRCMMVLRFVKVDEVAYLAEPLRVIRHPDPNLMEFHLPVVSKSNGVHFSDERDNRRLRRLVYSYTQIALSRMKLITA